MFHIGRSAAALAIVAAAAGAPAALTARAAGDTSPPSAIGNEVVTGIAVSPAYARTGLVAVAAADVANNKSFHLFVSHDGGATWGRAAGTGWDDSVPSIAVDAAGRETLYAGDKNGLLRSTDYGDTWTHAGAAGTADPSPHFASDGTIAVPDAYSNGADYVLHDGAAKPVSGSGGALIDHEFAFAPDFPAGGAQSPVLLSANDPKSGYPEVERCSAAFACTAPPSQLPGSTTFSGFANLSLSTAFGSDGVVFTQSSASIDKSIDGGRTFTPMVPLTDTAAAGTAYTGLVLDPHYRDNGGPRTVFAAEVLAYEDKTNPHTESGVFRSGDGGATWTREGIGTHLADNTNSLAIASDGRLFASFIYLRSATPDAGLLCSTDGGSSWRTFCPHVGSYSGAKAAGAVQGGTAGKPGAGAAPNAAGGQSSTTLPQTGVDQTGTGAGAARTLNAVSRRPPTQHNWLLTALLALLALAACGYVVAQRRRARRSGTHAPPPHGG